MAGIVGAYFEDQPELNGIAPGCQIISIKIGDSRLGSMETNPGLLRAMQYISDYNTRAGKGKGIDLINMSYGEAAAFQNSGIFVEAFERVVNQHGVIYVSSAGNDGPALSTVGAPVSISDLVIGVGAYVEPEMMRDEYGMAIPGFTERCYTWSSKGPISDGALGVTVCAPGGAVTSMPLSSLKKTQLMNGTSMASPNCCGSIALLLSALKAHPEMTYTPHSVRRAIENTARFCPEISPFNQGSGLLQIKAAWSWFQALPKEFAPYNDHRIKVRVDHSRRGLYLRNPTRLRRHALPGQTGTGEVPASAQLTPQFPRVESREIQLTPEKQEAQDRLNQLKLDYELRVDLKSTVDWIRHPSQLCLLSDGKGFDFQTDTSKLGPGVHYAEIQGVPEESNGLGEVYGPIFRIPITVVIPEPPQEHTEESDSKSRDEGLPPTEGSEYRFPGLQFPARSGTQERFFLEPPAGATWVDVFLTNKGPAAQDVEAAKKRQQTTKSEDAAAGATGRPRFMVHLLQLKSRTPYREHALRKYLSVDAGDTKLLSLPISGQQVLEVCVGQFWSTLAGAEIDLRVRFHGIEVEVHENFNGTEPLQKIVCTPTLQDEILDPSASVTTIRKTVAPSHFSLTPLPDPRRNNFQEDIPMYGLILQYEFKGAVNGKVTPRFPLVNGVLYESVFSCQMWMLFDQNKNLLGTGDSWPDPVTLKEGKPYILRFQLTHHNHSLLEQLKSTCVNLDWSLPKSLEIPVYGHYTQAIQSLETGKRKSNPKKLRCRQGVSTLFYLQAPLPKALKKAAKWADAGDVLLGHFTLGGGARSNQLGSGKRPKGFPLSLVVPPKASPTELTGTSKSGSKQKQKKKVEEEEEEEEGKTPEVGEEDSDESPKAATEAEDQEEEEAGDSAEEGEEKKDVSPEEELRDLQINALSKLIPGRVAGLLERKTGPASTPGKGQLKKLETLEAAWLPGLLEAFPKHLPLLSLQLRSTAAKAFAPRDEEKNGMSLPAGVVKHTGHPPAAALAAEDLDRMEKAGKAVLEVIDAKELAAHFGLRHDLEDPKVAAKDKEQKKTKQILLQAHTALLQVIKERLHTVRLQKQEEKTPAAEETEEALEKEWAARWKDYSQWADPLATLPVELLALEWNRKQESEPLGRLLEVVGNTLREVEAKVKTPEAWKTDAEPLWEVRQSLLRAAGWKEWAEAFELEKCVGFPRHFTRF